MDSFGSLNTRTQLSGIYSSERYCIEADQVQLKSYIPYVKYILLLNCLVSLVFYGA